MSSLFLSVLYKFIKSQKILALYIIFFLYTLFSTSGCPADAGASEYFAVAVWQFIALMEENLGAVTEI